jgi:hypothetical protein
VTGSGSITSGSWTGSSTIVGGLGDAIGLGAGGGGGVGQFGGQPAGGALTLTVVDAVPVSPPAPWHLSL